MKRVFSFLWNNSPKCVVWTLLNKAVGRSAHEHVAVTNQRYRNDLLELFWSFIHSTYPKDSLPKDEFAGLILKYQSSDIIRSNNIYFGDLWNLFAPDYRNRLQEYYTHMQYHSTMRFLEKSANPTLIQDHYVRPYQVARGRLRKFSVLEVGGGVPHGFVYESLYNEDNFCDGLTLVEVDSIYTQFVEWFCWQRDIPFTLVTATAGETAKLPKYVKYDFVFAKDVFEHLRDPKGMLNQILSAASTRAILALDIEDKGEAVYQHISPRLSPLKDVLNEGGYVAFSQTGNITLFCRAGDSGRLQKSS